MDKRIFKIIIADDNRFFADALRDFLNKKKSFDVLATCNTIDDTIKQTNSTNFDLLILDLSFRGVRSLDFIKQIRPEKSKFKIVCLTSYNNKIIKNEAIKNGVDHFLGKDDSIENFPALIKTILTSDIKIHNAIQPQLSSCELTARQIDIIKACFIFSTEKEIADSLGISINTLKTHKQNLFTKTSTKNNIQLIKFGIKEGIIVV
ncbi:response regulator transcription factor [Ochrovirga pacifica]|uniref:response regulator transcription factor n=1 Tax=Ochrovirga pacifica TaxID=1042376 RepID=UPI000255A274|nr:response regulator transcription factor [Ochrovirga pacifica]